MEWKCQVAGCGKVMHASRWSALEKMKQEHMQGHREAVGIGPGVQAAVSSVVSRSQGRPPAMLTTPFNPLHNIAVKRATRKCKNCDDMVFDSGAAKPFHVIIAFGAMRKHPGADDECICGCVEPE